MLSYEDYLTFLTALNAYCQNYSIPDTERSVLSHLFMNQLDRSYSLLPLRGNNDKELLMMWSKEIESRIRWRMVYI